MAAKSRVDGTSKRSIRKRVFNLVMSGADRRPFHTKIASHHAHATKHNLTLGVVTGRLPKRRSK